MPEVVLSGTFLDFGKSLWQSDRVASLYPGLVSDPDFKPTGRFGIGFYASFIIGRNVKVLTKPFNAGDNKRKVLHFKDGMRGRAELRDYDLELDGDWPYGQHTIVEIRFAGEEWLSNFASLSLHAAVDYPISSSEERYWELFHRTFEQSVFCLDVGVELTCPFFANKRVNCIDIFAASNEDFAERFNQVFSSYQNQKIAEELIPLIEVMGDSRRPRTRGTIATDDFIRGVYHIGGLTVFSPEAMGPYQTRYVTGVHEAIPDTMSRQVVARLAPRETFAQWAHSQLDKLYTSSLSESQIAKALISIHAITGDLANKYFLLDMHWHIVYFRDMDLDPSDKVFIICSQHPLLKKSRFHHIKAH